MQQAVGYTLRLYYATPLVSGQLDQDAPDGASLQRVGNDLQYTREIGGRRYTVVERRFLLIPERSGPLTIPGARFAGRGTGGFFDDMFGDGSRELSANGAPRFVNVRPVPANAPQPWLPLRGLSLRYLATPQTARAGEAATVTIEASADGATAAQMPELQLPAIDGAQVFAEPAQTDETFDDGRPQVEGHAQVLDRAVARGRAAHSRAAHRMVGRACGDGAHGVVARRQAAGRAGRAGFRRGCDACRHASDGTVIDEQPPATARRAATVPVSGRWRRRRSRCCGWRRWSGHCSDARMRRRRDRRWRDRMRRRRAAAGTRSLRDLKSALDTGDLGDVADVLCAMAQPPAGDLDAVRARLDDAAQRDAVAQLQRARWGDGDGSAARTALRAAFASGPALEDAPPRPEAFAAAAAVSRRS